MPAMPTYGENNWRNIVKNQKIDDLEGSYGALDF